MYKSHHTTSYTDTHKVYPIATLHNHNESRILILKEWKLHKWS